MRVIDREALESTMLAELRTAWATLRGRHPGERFYIPSASARPTWSTT